MRIFDRRRAVGVSVTPAGARFLAAAQRLLAAEAEFARAVDLEAQTPPRKIRIGCFEPFGAIFMTAVLRRYIDAVGPVEVTLLEGDYSQLPAWFSSGAVDFVVDYDAAPPLGGSVTPICKAPPHAVLSAKDPLAKRRVLRLADLATRPLILLDTPTNGAYPLALFEVLASRPEIALRTRSYETVRAAVAEGLGVSVLNMRPYGPELSLIARRPLADELPSPTLQVVDVYGDLKPEFVRRFIAVIHDFFADLGAERFAVATPDRLSGLLFPAPVGKARSAAGRGVEPLNSTRRVFSDKRQRS